MVTFYTVSGFMRVQALFFLIEILFSAFFCPAASPAFSDFDDARRQQDEAYREAERLCRAVLKAQPKSVPALTNLGVVLARQGEIQPRRSRPTGRCLALASRFVARDG